jgi:hypothetical protein
MGANRWQEQAVQHLFLPDLPTADLSRRIMYHATLQVHQLVYGHFPDQLSAFFHLCLLPS